MLISDSPSSEYKGLRIAPRVALLHFREPSSPAVKTRLFQKRGKDVSSAGNAGAANEPNKERDFLARGGIATSRVLGFRNVTPELLQPDRR